MNEPTKPDDSKVARFRKRVVNHQAISPNLKTKVGKTGAVALTFGSDDDDTADYLRIMEAMGTPDTLFFTGLLAQICNAVSLPSGVQEHSVQFAVSVIKSIGPKNELEAMLATQMAAIHICALDSSRRFFCADTLERRDSAERAMTKMTRTFAMQMETLKRYRAKAQQVVRVERVTVQDGGQAIVGAVQHGGSANDEI